MAKLQMSNANAGQRKVIATALPLPPDVTPYFIVFVVTIIITIPMANGGVT